MVIGAQGAFAIESSITQAYERLSLRALGFFVIYVGGRSYGVRSSDATMLACSFDEVQDRIRRRGAHIAPFATDPNAAKIATAFRDGVFSVDHESERFFGFSQPEFSALFYANHLIWAPDGDEAFDDGSYVLHFDSKERVRLIAFRCVEDGRPDLATLSDMWLKADEFYGLLQQWRDAFEREWLAKPRISEEADQAT